MTEVENENVKRLTLAAKGGIQSADNKATALVSLGASLIAIVAGLVAIRSSAGEVSPLGIALIIGFTIATLAAVLASCAALFPRVGRKALLSGRGWTPLDRSSSYYNDIVALTREQFLDLMKTDPADDLREQAFVLCIIADRKMLWLRWSVFAFIVACFFLTAFVAAAVLYSPAEGVPSLRPGFPSAAPPGR